MPPPGENVSLVIGQLAYLATVRPHLKKFDFFGPCRSVGCPWYLASPS